MPQDDWRWYRDWAYDGASQRTDDPDLDRQLTDLERPGALARPLGLRARANIPPEVYAPVQQGVGPSRRSSAR